ncbi:MAG: alpha/beta fold hydrolase [Chitinophagaceae bacterium]
MEKYFEYQSVKIFYRIIGKGKPVVLLHGLPVDGNIWNNQIEFLKNNCRLIVPDLPGSGKSEIVNQSINQPVNQLSTIEFFADCIYALLQHENINECIMIGHSMGGYITLAFTEKHKQILNGFGLVHSTAFADNEERKENRKRAIEFVEKYGASAFLKTMIPNLFSSSFKKNHSEKMNAFIEEKKNYSSKSFIQYYVAMMNRPDRTDVLKNCKKPVLFVMGTEDTAASLNDVLQQTQLPEIAYIHILENVAHMSMWEAPDKLNNFLLQFINEVNDLH